MELNLSCFPCNKDIDIATTEYNRWKASEYKKCEGCLIPVLIITDMQRSEYINKNVQKITWKCTICNRIVKA